MVPDNIIEEIKSRTNIVNVVSRFVDLKRTGSNFKGLCPFHSEKTPSFIVSEDKQIFHCFGCGTGGNVFTFLMRNDGKSFPDVITELAKDAGVLIPASQKKVGKGSVKDNRESILRVNKFALRFYHQTFFSDSGIEARRYLARRGISKEMIENYRIGYAPDSWDALQKALSNNGVPIQLMCEAGLLIQKKSSLHYYDRFRDRIIFPILDPRNQVVGFGGRALSDKQDAKYLNSPETAVYQKSKILYGLNSVKQEIRHLDEVIIVEGYIDQISLFQAGIKNVVATLGTALTEEHLHLIEKYTNNLVLVYDGDNAGKNAAIRGAKITIKLGMGCRVVILPSGEDPDSYIRSHQERAFRGLVKSGRNALEFLVEDMLKNSDRGAQARMRAIENLSPVLGEIKNVIARELYSKELAERLGISHNLIESIINSKGDKLENQPNKIFLHKQIDPRNNQNRSEWLILEQVLKHTDLSQKLIDEDAINLIEDKRLKDILEWIVLNFKSKKRWVESDLLTQVSDSKLHGRLSAIMIANPALEKEEALKVVEDCIYTLKQQQILFLKQDLLAKIKEYDLKGDVERSALALRTYQELVHNQKERSFTPSERVNNGKGA